MFRMYAFLVLALLGVVAIALFAVQFAIDSSQLSGEDYVAAILGLFVTLLCVHFAGEELNGDID